LCLQDGLVGWLGDGGSRNDDDAGVLAIAHAKLRRRTRTILLSRCTQLPESRLFVCNPFPGFDCIFAALKSRTVAHKTRTKFLLKFVRDLSTNKTLSFLRASLLVRNLSTNSSANSGN
jgi:hypothetical protein